MSRWLLLVTLLLLLAFLVIYLSSPSPLSRPGIGP
jgi:hypothetical protein